jgi:hypothetical protein
MIVVIRNVKERQSGDIAMIRGWRAVVAVVCLGVASAAARAAGPAGLLAEWSCQEGQGDVLHDVSGNCHDGKIHAATWVKCGDGFALDFNAVGAYVDFANAGSLNTAGPLTMEAWVNPTAAGWAEPVVMGMLPEGGEFMFTNRSLCWWSVGKTEFAVGAKLELGQWSHLVGTFDGKRRTLWVNGRLTASRECNGPTAKGGTFMFCSPRQPHFMGLIGRVRLFNRALPMAEVCANYKADATAYGFDPEWFQRLKVTPFYYFDRGEIVVEMDYSGLRPLQGKAEIEVTLSNEKDEASKIERRVIPLPEVSEAAVNGWGNDPAAVETRFSTVKLPPGKYLLSATLRDANASRPAERIAFDYPTKTSLPSPAARSAGNLPPGPEPVPYTLEMAKGGGFRLLIKGNRYPFETRVSWPNGDFNRLSASDEPAAKGEESWKADVRSAGTNRHEADAGGAFYTIHRVVETFPTHVSIRDTFTNTTGNDLGLLIYDEMPAPEKEFSGCRLSGFEGGGWMDQEPNYRSCSVFVKDANVGFGILPLDSVFILQSIQYAQGGVAGTGTERFALPPGKSYTLEWAVYPTGSGDYYDFINAYRKVEGCIGTVDGGVGYVSYGPDNRRQVPDNNFVEKRNLKYGIISCLSRSADDPGISIEGIEFIDFPKERALTGQQAAAIKKKFPEMKVMFHIAHTLYATNKPERYADSKINYANGTQAAHGGFPDFSKERIAEGWAWWCFYPTPGNSFHDALMKSVDVMMDEIGVDGAFVDGFLLSYGGPWTYGGRWDEHSAEIDPATRTIKRKVSSVLLLMEPSMIQYARKIHDKRGVIIANGPMITRNIAKEKYIFFDAECEAGPHCHLAPTILSLADGPFRSEKELYRDVLDKLRWGVLYIYYNDRIPLTYNSLGTMEFPMTFEEIRSGMVKGKERIVTMNSGVYGWPGDHRLHLIHEFDSRGGAAPHQFVTTADLAGVRSAVQFGQHESAVIEPVPVTLEAATPVNARVLHHDSAATKILLNGQGEARLNIFVGSDYPDWRAGVFTDGGVSPLDVGYGALYRVTIGGAQKTIKECDGTLTVPLQLAGEVEVSVERAEESNSR